MFELPPTRPRLVFHVDMDCYFVQVARLADPSLVGKPVIVGGHSTKRGVVTSASYEARAFGVHSAMPLHRALALCPQATVVPVDMDACRRTTGLLLALWQEFAPVVEVAGLDEAYLDMTGCDAVLGDAARMAESLQRQTLERTGLTCSVGAASSKLVAKTASKIHKPGGRFAVAPGTEREWLAPYPVETLHGVGPVTARKLQTLGLRTLGQLQQADPDRLSRSLGPSARSLVAMACGVDARPVSPNRPAKSVGAETTFDVDVADPHRIAGLLLELSQQAAWRLRRQGGQARTVTLKVRYAPFETVERSVTLGMATDAEEDVHDALLALWRRHAAVGRPVRLLGVSLSNLGEARQLSLFEAAGATTPSAGGPPALSMASAPPHPDAAQRRRAHAAMDAIREKFGAGAIGRAVEGRFAADPRAGLS